MSTLINLALKYNTDKHEHGYMPFYEKWLPKNPIRLLEIGVKQGNSMRMWQEYFPDCELHGLDLFVEYQPPEDVNAIWHRGNQIDYLMLENLRRLNFDVIIDDGSHNSRDQMMTFFGLFAGKHYFIEDLQCGHEEFYRQGLPYEMTATSVFKRIIPIDELATETKYDINSQIVLIKC